VRKNLTDRFIRSVKPSDRQIDIWDTTFTGFGLRISTGGKKSFQILYRHNRLQRRMVIGAYPVLSVAEARKRARSLLADVAKGHDPAAERLADRNAETFEELAADYLKYHAKPKKRTWPEDERVIEVELRPAWRSRKAKDITRRDIRDLVQGIADRGAGVMANRTLSLIRQIFNYGIENDWMDVNPCQRIVKPGAERERARALTADEIRKVWTSLDKEPPDEAAVLRLQLLTGQRIGEVRQIQVGDIDLERAWWTIPATRTKNNREHRVPLSTSAIHILKNHIAHSNRIWVFASPTLNARPLGYPTIYYAIQRVIERSGVKDWCSHDLRRTVATHLGESGVPRLVIGKILNHTDTGVTRIYDRHTYDPDKKMALDAWARRLEGIIEGKEITATVLPIKKGQR
jgi:integrase